MISVSFVVGDIRQVQGVTRYTECLLSQNDLFKQSSINFVNLYSSDSTYPCGEYCSQDIKRVVLKSNRRAGLRSRIKNLAFFKSSFTQFLLVMREYLCISKQSADRCLKSEEHEEVLVFQDLFAAFRYLSKRNEQKAKVILVTHAADDPLGQMLGFRNKLNGTVYERVIRKMVDYAFAKSDSIVVICDTAKEYIKKRYGINPIKISNAVPDIDDSIRFNRETYLRDAASEPINCAVVGTLSKRKGQDRLLSAFARMEDSARSRFIIHIFGGGEQEREIKDYCVSHDLTERVVFYGAVENIAKHLIKMDVLLLPTRMDTVPLAIIEAMRGSVPFFSTNVGGIPELYEDGVGMLFSSDDEGMDEMLKAVLAHNKELKNWGKNARKRYERYYSLKAQRTLYIELFSKLVK